MIRYIELFLRPIVLGAWWITIWARRTMARHRLAGRSDWLLRDIGWTRKAAERERAAPFWRPVGSRRSQVAAVPRNNASISSRRGIEGAVPCRVTESPATAQPNRAASAGAKPRARPTANPPLNASPAPVVSTTVPARNEGTC